VSESTEDRAAGAASGAPKRRGDRTSHTVGAVVLASVVVLALVTGLSVVFLYRHLNGNLTVEDVSSALGERPDKLDAGPQDPINVLVMGSDTRDCDGCALDQETGAEASDTTILMHLSADRERAYGISIPRDTIVDRPACGEDDEVPAAKNVMWNDAYTQGGQACTIRQFEELTGIYVDHYVVVNFNGFKDMVNAIDGVEVCIPEDIDDPAHGINIDAGTRTLHDAEALNYVRARYTLGDGSDISRIKRQQAFVASMAHKVISRGTLARIDRLVGFLDAATESLTVDPGLENVTKLGQLGLGFQGIGLDSIKFLTAPNAYYPEDSDHYGRVYLTDEAPRLWRLIENDRTLPADLLGGSISAGALPGADRGQGAQAGGNGQGGGKPGGKAGGRGRGSGGPTEEERVAQAEANGLCA
jgi:LCP family protein required for cell wall assembly